jgi:hypothetical protein
MLFSHAGVMINRHQDIEKKTHERNLNTKKPNKCWAFIHQVSLERQLKS